MIELTLHNPKAAARAERRTGPELLLVSITGKLAEPEQHLQQKGKGHH